ncbi:hypothetical protein AWC23_20265 [Mycobacterium saskatchewanense]|uniref:Uncharacterized protein n=1 Tax=Mycobacterium saskatchewanense TaxID=220927 RepID=A0AAJ3NN28_9MYCO|nr:hypothetical protein AWC23_20265 [Mycobacterium saskatchewanense]
MAGFIDTPEAGDVSTSWAVMGTLLSTFPTCSAVASRLGNVPTSNAGAAAAALGDGEAGPGLAEADGWVDDDRAVLDVGPESLLPSTTSVITRTAAITTAAPATHHGHTGRCGGDGGYPPAGMPVPPGA